MKLIDFAKFLKGNFIHDITSILQLYLYTIDPPYSQLLQSCQEYATLLRILRQS